MQQVTSLSRHAQANAPAASYLSRHAPAPRLLLLFFKPTRQQHKAAGKKTGLDILNYGCNGNLLSGHGVVERNRISSLQSHGKALEKKCCLSGVVRDSDDSIIIMQRLTRHVSVIRIMNRRRDISYTLITKIKLCMSIRFISRRISYLMAFPG